MSEEGEVSRARLALEKDLFLRAAIRELSGTLEDVVGLDEAFGFISIIGQKIGDWIDAEYRQALHTEKLDWRQVRDALIDLKTRIDGDFYLFAEDDARIALGNRRCPFGDKVRDRYLRDRVG